MKPDLQTSSPARLPLALAEPPLLPHSDPLRSEEALHRVLARTSEQSLPVSRDAGRTQVELARVADHLLSRPGASAGDQEGALRQVPRQLDERCVQHEATRSAASADERFAILLARLRAVFDADPVEDGVSHAAEEILNEAIHSTPHAAATMDRLLHLIDGPANPGLAASALRCLGRLDSPGTTEWRRKLVEAALRHSNVELRDAAIQAAETWAEPQLVPTLRAHEEPEPWLREYLQDVIDDISS